MDVSSLERMLALPGMLIFGTMTVVIQKMIFGTTAHGKPEYATLEACAKLDPPMPAGCARPFKKPWFQVEGMFLGMFGCLLVYEVMVLYKRWKKREERLELLLEEEKSAEGEKDKKHWLMYIKVLVPGILDLMATGLMNIGLLWTPASVWQMMRGSMVIFSSIESVVFLKRKLYAYNWIAVVEVVCALIVVGMAAIFNQKDGDSKDSSKLLLGIVLVIVAQVIQATQVVIEEFLLHDVKANPFFIVGLEGMWGTIFTCALILPIVGFMPGTEGEGIMEDSIDSFKMLGDSGVLLFLIFIYAFAILVYNGTAMMVTQQSSAVMRTIMEAMRTACIWVVQVILYYSLRDTTYFKEHQDLGEKLTVWSVLQLVGFLMLVLGSALYKGALRIPGCYYPPPPPESINASTGEEEEKI